MRRPQSIPPAAPTSTFLGSHPRRAQVPPNGLESTLAPCRPAERPRDATADAAVPVPIATRSNFFITVFLYMKPRAALVDLGKSPGASSDGVRSHTSDKIFSSRA